ncbi:MAG: hypothetical protein FJ161_03015, partial [Gammaproteobacteria bacterium]|nr:hypothetical protein [Gammaproteobacteria bacterium]
MQSTFSEIFRLIQETDFKNPSALTYESAIALLNQNPIAKAILERYFPDKLKSFLRNLSHLYRDLRHEIRPQQNIHDFTNNNIQRNDTIEVLQWSRSQLEEYHIAITEENASSVANDFCNRTQELCTPSHIQRLYPEKTSAQISAIVIDFKDFIEYICQSSQTIELLPILVAYYLDVHKQSEEELADHVFSFLNDLNSSRVSNKDVHPKVISANHPLSKGIDRDWSCIKGLEEDMTYTLLLRNRAKNTEQSSALQTRTNAVTPEEYTQALFDWVITHNQSLSSEFINLIIAIIVDENYQLSQSQHESFYLSFENASQKEAILSRLVTSKYNQLLEECGQITHTSQSDFLNYYYALYPDLLESGLLSIEKIDCAHALRANKPIMIELRRKFSAYIALPQIHETIFYKPNTRLTESLRQYINFVALCDFIKDTPHLYENLIQSIEDLTPDALFNYTWNIKNYLQLQHAIKAAHNHSLSLQFSQDDQRAFEQILHEDISQLIQEGLYRHFESMITQPSATAEAMVNKLATNGLSSTDLETLSFEKSIYFSTFFIKKSENGESTIIDLNDSESAKELQSSLIEQLSSLMSPQWVEALDRILYPMGLFNSCINVIQSIKTEFSYDRSDVSRKLLECCERIDILQSRIIRESYQNPLFELFLLDSPQTIQALFETQTLLIEKISKEKALYKPERRHLIRINFNRMTTHKNDYTLYCAQDTLFRMYSMMIADFMRIHFSEIQSRPLDHIDRFDRELIRMIARANFSLEHKKELLHILVPLDTLSLNQHPYFWQFLYSIAIDRALLEYFTAQLHSEQKNSVLLTTILASSGYEDFVTMKHLIEQIDREYLQEKNLFDADTTPIESLKIFIDENVLSDKTLFVAFKACLTQEHYEMAYFLCTTKIAISYDRLRIITNLHPNLPKKIQNAIMDNYFSYTKNPFSIASKMQNILEMLRPLVIDLRNTQGFLIRHYHLPLNNETPYTYFRAILQSEELYRNCDTLADVCSILALLDILPSAI